MCRGSHIFPISYLAQLDYLHSISEVIILNNDQHQLKKKSNSKGLIPILSNNIQFCRLVLLSEGSFVSEVLFQKMLVCSLQVCLAWTRIILPNRQGEYSKTCLNFAGCAFNSLWTMGSQVSFNQATQLSALKFVSNWSCC